MTSRDFVYWLQGYLEVAGAGGQPVTLSAEQLECVRKHLAMVFAHEIDPSMGSPQQQKKLDAIHHHDKPLMRC